MRHRKSVKKISNDKPFPSVSLFLLFLSLTLTILLAFLLETKRLQAVMSFLSFASENNIIQKPYTGVVTSTSGTVWITTKSSVHGPIQLHLSTDPTLINKAIPDEHVKIFTMNPIKIATQLNTLWKVDIKNLTPNTIYYVGVYISDTYINFSSLPYFRTLQADK